jgi:diguanylate cyclase (GGDEF)-like protein
MHPSYNPLLVALSLVVAVIASYTAFDISHRITALRPQGWRRRRWLLGGAMAVGTGTWSMHFIGMLACLLPVPMGYDPGITFYSWVIAVGVSYLALETATQTDLGLRGVAVGGTLMGLGIAGMHYNGMAAMRMVPEISYRPGLVLLSVAVAILASWAAMYLLYLLRDAHAMTLAKQLTAAGFMGAAIAGMHYIGMSAASFSPGMVCQAATRVSPGWLAFTVTVTSFGILALALLLSMLETRLDQKTGELNESLEDMNRRLRQMAILDALTGLTNRKGFTDRLELAVERARADGQACMLLFMDLDGFKTINDSLGHSPGDEVLRLFAQRLARSVRRDDGVARLGGDEFGVLLEELASIEDAAAIAEDILANLQHDMVIGGSPLRVTASIGIAVYPQDGETAEVLLKNADAAMYEAKQAGRNTYRFFEPRMSEAAARMLRIQRGLSEALRNHHLSLAYQPLFDGADGKLVGAEALIRWRHPELGNIPPGDFIPVAERSGQIIEVGDWVIREVCRHIRKWNDAGLTRLRIAINLSPQQLRQPNFVENVLAMVTEASVSPDRIMFEVTETVAMQDAERMTEIVREFQSLGFEIAIDDFGTGYSSLSYLQRFRVKQLKIDRFFTHGLDSHGEEGLAIVSAIIALAHALQMEVVAEGVETGSQLEKLQELACDRLQGYLLAKPLPSQAFEEMLAARLELVERDAKVRSDGTGMEPAWMSRTGRYLA